MALLLKIRIFLLLWAIILGSVTLCPAQKLIARNGLATFFSSTPIEDISAVNRNVLSILDLQQNKIEVSMLIKAFSFKKALMQEHFNENYLESHKFPKATFKGAFVNKDLPQTNADGPYNLTAKGELNIHGVTQMVEIPVTLFIKNGKVKGEATFFVNPSDYNISIPALVKDKIAKTIEVKTQISYE